MDAPAAPVRVNPHGAQRQGPSFQILRSLFAGLSTDAGSHACLIVSPNPLLSRQITHAFHCVPSRRQSRINPGAGGGCGAGPNRTQQCAHRVGSGQRSRFDGFIPTVPS